ncbi:MAG: recombinase family protein, partial [Dehalococcoidia bacterium]
MRLAIEEQLDRHSLDAQRRAIEVACAERKAKGLHNGLVPFGYRTGSAGIAEPDPATQDGAIRAFEMAATGAGYTKIAKELNVCSFRTAGNMRRDVFTKDSVRDILANRFYLGELPIIEPRKSRRIRDRQPGQHPALIDGATFDAARQAIGARASSSGAQRREASIYSLSGLLRCAHCSERMRVMRTEKGRVRYHCRSKAQGLGCTGSGSFLDTDEQQIVADLAAFAFPAEPIGEYPLRGCLGKRTHHRVRPAPAGTRAAVPGADRCGATNRGA